MTSANLLRVTDYYNNPRNPSSQGYRLLQSFVEARDRGHHAPSASGNTVWRE